VADAANLLEQAKRAREQAARARVLAQEMPTADRARAIRFAEELEEKADELEQRAASTGAPSPPQMVSQPQHQAQQQQDADPPAGPPDGKPKS
jgi:hypothetical protein